ncbi:MAG TPA: PDZ domain-containing protein [Candidatus Saccharimonadaceae bacterium]|jgi:tricorn protease|nr:PDZ domain-containing protein [Candidatus Saccharimonadaceae bacterium]
MFPRRPGIVAVALVASLARFVSPAAALEECRLLRQPDIQGDRIVFVYGGDLWTVSRAGGVAARVTSHDGVETFPKFSPDGKTIAFTAEYDGNVDAYTVPTDGGEPRRLTWHPGVDAVMEWYPDGKAILARTARASATRVDRFERIPVNGGFETVLPLQQSGYASFSDDGSKLAFVSPTYDRRTWKRYKGGNAPDIWIYDFAHNTSEKITDWEGADEWPMWHGGTIYYCTDQGGRTANVWAYDVAQKTRRQVTHFTDYDVRWPSIGRDALVFENGGYLYVMDLSTEQAHKIQVLVPDDKPATRAEYRDVSKWIENADLSPSAKRVVIEARGELFTAPAEHGDVRNLTNTPGARERNPVWSPDGKWIAFLSDASGEYELHVIGSDGKSPDRQVTKGGHTFRYAPMWSPDSKKLLFSDKTSTLWWCDVASGALTKVDKASDGEIMDYAWSGDSRWITYARFEANNFRRVMLYALDGGKLTAVSSGMTDDFAPAFDPDGRWLYFVSQRAIDIPAFQFEYNFPYAETNKIYAVALRDSIGSPVPPQSDEEGAGEKAADKGGDKDKKGKDEDKKATPALHIDLAGIGGRVTEMPIRAGRYTALHPLSDKILFLALDAPDPDANGPGKAAIHVFDFAERKDQTILSGVQATYAVSKDGAKVLYRTDDAMGLVDAKPNQKMDDGKIDTTPLTALVDPRQEWMQMFNEAWRLERDYYYDPAMGGLDWNAIGERYRQLVPYVAHRSDLNYILGELIGELSTSHTYVGGGDAPEVKHVDIGLLGADWSLDAASGRYRIDHVYRARDWNSKVAAPLGEPGVNVHDGDFLLAVNGRPVRAPENVFAAFTGTTGKITTITVSASAGDTKGRTYTVKPIANEQTLRYTAWVDGMREQVAKATGGRVAYVHVPNTATLGIQEFTKQYYPQIDKQALIVDDRFNGGGFIPDFFVERLRRTTWSYWATRDGNDTRTPATAIDGPKCILANHYAGSGGDCFPYFFREAGVGPVIGTRTWGGLVGISHSLPLVDGGSVTMPDFGFWDPRTGKWEVENHGVDPDIEIENTPDSMVSGHDLQLERAIQWTLDELKAHPPAKPPRPAFKVQPGLSK